MNKRHTHPTKPIRNCALPHSAAHSQNAIKNSKSKSQENEIDKHSQND